MKRNITETRNFAKAIDSLLKRRQLLREDLIDFKKQIAENPESGDMVPGTGGVRKARLKSASKGKRGGFRVCYYDIVNIELIYLIAIYPKNVQEDLTTEQKKALKELVGILRKANK